MKEWDGIDENNRSDKEVIELFPVMMLVDDCTRLIVIFPVKGTLISHWDSVPLININT